MVDISVGLWDKEQSFENSKGLSETDQRFWVHAAFLNFFLVISSQSWALLGRSLVLQEEWQAIAICTVCKLHQCFG